MIFFWGVVTVISLLVLISFLKSMQEGGRENPEKGSKIWMTVAVMVFLALNFMVMPREWKSAIYGAVYVFGASLGYYEDRSTMRMVAPTPPEYRNNPVGYNPSEDWVYVNKRTDRNYIGAHGWVMSKNTSNEPYRSSPSYMMGGRPKSASSAPSWSFVPRTKFTLSMDQDSKLEVNFACDGAEIYDEKLRQCVPMRVYESIAANCETNTAENLPRDYFVTHFLYDPKSCAGGDYELVDPLRSWLLKNVSAVHQIEQSKCQSGYMSCFVEFSGTETCPISAGYCLCAK